MSGLLERGVEALERIAAALEGERVIPPGKPSADTSSDSTSAKEKETTGSKDTSKKESSTSKKSDKAPSREEVRDALKEVQKKHDAQTARDVLAEFGVPGISALEEDQYADVIAAAKKAL